MAAMLQSTYIIGHHTFSVVREDLVIEDLYGIIVQYIPKVKVTTLVGRAESISTRRKNYDPLKDVTAWFRNFSMYEFHFVVVPDSRPTVVYIELDYIVAFDSVNVLTPECFEIPPLMGIGLLSDEANEYSATMVHGVSQAYIFLDIGDNLFKVGPYPDAFLYLFGEAVNGCQKGIQSCGE
jgi:hypothetical protein